MNLLRPRYLALAFAAYFGVVCYYAAQEGRRAAFGAYGPGISLTVFQTTMVGAVLVLLGLFVTASISPQIKGAAPSRSPGSLGTSRVIRRLRGDSGMPDDYRTRLQADSAWPAGDEFLADPSDAEMSAYRDLEQAQDAAAVSAALSRLVPTGEPPTAGTLAAALIERIAESVQRVLLDIERMKATTQQVHAAEMTAAEAVALLDTGNYAAALDRAAKARESLAKHVGVMPSRVELSGAPSSFVALAGPSLVAVVFVAVSLMLLPGVTVYLVANYKLNASAILALSYGWLGLLLYALVSVYYVLRPPSIKGSAKD